MAGYPCGAHGGGIGAFHYSLYILLVAPTPAPPPIAAPTKRAQPVHMMHMVPITASVIPLLIAHKPHPKKCLEIFIFIPVSPYGAAPLVESQLLRLKLNNEN